MSNFAVDYNDLLFVKMQHEYIVFLDDLKSMSVDEVIERAYEKTIKQELIYLCEENELPQNEAKALYEMKNSLDVVYQEWLKKDTNINEVFIGILTETAQKEIESLQNNANPQEPILPNTIPALSGMIQTQ